MLLSYITFNIGKQLLLFYIPNACKLLTIIKDINKSNPSIFLHNSLQSS